MSAGAAAGGSIVASALIAGWQSAEQSLNESKYIKAQNAARIKQLNQQFAYDTQNLYNNQIAITEQKLKNDVLIQENKLEAQDAFTQAFAGSGIKGRSVDALEAQIDNEVAKSQVENSRQAEQQNDRQFLGLMRSGQRNIQEINNLNSFDSDAAKANSDMAAMMAGIGAAADNAKYFF